MFRKIEELIGQPESERLEFKAAGGGEFNKGRICEYCVGIANVGGGHLLLGVAEKSGRIVGTKAIGNVVKMREFIHGRTEIRVKIREEILSGKRIVVFEIPPRPSGKAYRCDGRYFTRIGQELMKMSDEELKKIHFEGKEPWEQDVALQGCGVEGVLQLLDSREFFGFLERPYPSDSSNVLGELERRDLIQDDGGGRYSILNKGALLLANDLRDFPDLSRKALRVITYGEEGKVGNPTSDTIDYRGYAVGFERMVEGVMERLTRGEIIKGPLRHERKLVPEVVMREILANALVHQDLELAGIRPTVSVYQNRVSITNAGAPIVDPKRIIDYSQSRNEQMMDLMRMFGICEERGSGIDRVIAEVEKFQMPAPDFLGEGNQTEVIVYGARPFSDMSREDKLRSCYQHCVLLYVSSRKMTNKTLRERFALDARQSSMVSQIINAAMEQKLVKRDTDGKESRKYAKYVPFWA